MEITFIINSIPHQKPARLRGHGIGAVNMGREPASTNPSDPKNPSVAKHVKQSAAFSKILRIVCGSLAFLTIALIWGPSFPTKEIGAATGQSTVYSGSPVTSEASSTSATSTPRRNRLPLYRHPHLHRRRLLHPPTHRKSARR